MEFKKLSDFANEANEQLGAFRLEFMLSPDLLSRDDYEIDVLKWDSIKYGNEELGKVPDDKSHFLSGLYIPYREVEPLCIAPSVHVVVHIQVVLLSATLGLGISVRIQHPIGGK